MSSQGQISKKISDDFKSLELKIVIKNHTSNKEIISSPNHPISITEVLDKGFILNLPPFSGSQGHQLLLDVYLNEGDEKILDFSATAKIIDIDTSDPMIMRTSVKFAQFDPFTWKKFLRTYEDSQNQIQKLLTSLRGANHD